ncbi:hypothetical protein C3432_01855 [Citrobacter amalonaticus]|uniref:Uncharacterized protein n=1 Tax=Citrobacter amalonaticus TaxID=35703 RepID=A0A2S4S2H8_CITAM|nr:hypothetical protein [Citrobacter amalonaticus]POT59491.1 hypothetical protein C3432_01855 [Citrobacter amalonaticus]POT77621.1 hypothetical protein C3436_09525 [Citrobacter amalonaticus]POU68073.1 hypothetical protein C3430_03060 [Citrobacter amalonaticus]POV07677.1 hypothetical protein C3424_03070 [Citrobacter amalonaticus]
MLAAINSGAYVSQINRSHAPSVVLQSNNPVINKARELTENLHKLPGIPADARPEDIQKHRNNLLTCLDAVEKTGNWACQQDDRSIRPVAVGLQGIFEEALLSSLESGDVARADIIFTTANPPTPLCHSDALRTPSLLSNSVASDAGSYDTVISRVHTVPALLNHPSVNLCSIYSQERENPVDQNVYDDVCLAHPDKSKFYSLCSGVPLPDNLSGANYFVVSKDNNVNLFALRITQANKETDNCVIFTRDEQQKLKDLCDNYLDNVQAKYPGDDNLGKFMELLRQNYA